MNQVVNFYVDKVNDVIHTYCTECAPKSIEEIEYIDKAGEWDECEVCEFQNVPDWYYRKYDRSGDRRL